MISKPKGRPPLEPRIKALEENLAALQRTVERLIKAQPRDVVDKAYQSVFDKWPSATDPTRCNRGQPGCMYGNSIHAVCMNITGMSI